MKGLFKTLSVFLIFSALLFFCSSCSNNKKEKPLPPEKPSESLVLSLSKSWVGNRFEPRSETRPSSVWPQGYTEYRVSNYQVAPILLNWNDYNDSLKAYPVDIEFQSRCIRQEIRFDGVEYEYGGMVVENKSNHCKIYFTQKNNTWEILKTEL